MRLRSRKPGENITTTDKTPEDDTSDDSSSSSDDSDLDSDEDFRDIASQAGQLFKLKLGLTTIASQCTSAGTSTTSTFVIDKTPSTSLPKSTEKYKALDVDEDEEEEEENEEEEDENDTEEQTQPLTSPSPQSGSVSYTQENTSNYKKKKRNKRFVMRASTNSHFLPLIPSSSCQLAFPQANPISSL